MLPKSPFPLSKSDPIPSSSVEPGMETMTAAIENDRTKATHSCRKISSGLSHALTWWLICVLRLLQPALPDLRSLHYLLH